MCVTCAGVLRTASDCGRVAYRYRQSGRTVVAFRGPLKTAEYSLSPVVHREVRTAKLTVTRDRYSLNQVEMDGATAHGFSTRRLDPKATSAWSTSSQEFSSDIFE